MNTSRLSLTTVLSIFSKLMHLTCNIACRWMRCEMRRPPPLPAAACRDPSAGGQSLMGGDAHHSEFKSCVNLDILSDS